MRSLFSWALSVVGVLLAAAVAVRAASEVVELDDQNFEHLTQAATGATTGDWFVAFKAPWCGHCVRLTPTWEEIAAELKGEVNVAEVDATKASGCATRFNVRAFPSLKLFHQGKVYDYRGPRDSEHLLAFARGGFKETPGVAVPLPPTFVDLVKSQVAEAVEVLKAMYVQILKEAQLVAKGEKPADAPFLVMIAMILVFFGLVVLTFAAIFTGPRGGASSAAEEARKKEKKNK